MQQLGTIRVPGLEPFKASFPLVSWQLLFFTGVAMGWHKQTMAAWFGALPWRRVLLLATVGTVGFVALRQAIISDLVTVNNGDKLLLFARKPLGVARLVNITLAFGLIYLLTDRFWKPLASTAGKLLIPFGQRSLYVFLAHCVLFLGCLILGVKHHPPFPLAPWWHLALDLLLIALLWIMVRYRFCFSLVPR